MLKKMLIVFCFISVMILAYLVINNHGSEKVADNILGTSINLNKVVLIDVREPSEYLSGHADGAINVPLGDILAGKDFEFDKNQQIQVYCRSGVRASRAKIKLEKDGFKHVNNIGGLSDWEKSGGKVCKSDKPEC